MGDSFQSQARSTSKKKEDEPFDQEQQFILRLPPGPAIALKRDVENGANIKDNLFIEIQPDRRKGTVRYGGQVLSCKTVDLPCIIESMKTTDKKTFYKTADISQMVICTNEPDFSDEEMDSPRKKRDKEKQHLWNHGLCPPLKNVRKRRFRKTLTKKPVDLADIEKEVKRLFRQDNEAVDVKYRLVEDGVSEEQSASQSGSGTVDQERKKNKPVEKQDLFGELSSSEDEDDEDVNIMDSEDEDVDVDEDDEEGGHVRFNQRVTQHNVPANQSFESEEMDEDGEGEELTEDQVYSKLSELEVELAQIGDSIRDLSSTSTSDSDPGIMEQLAELQAICTEKQAEYDSLKELMESHEKAEED